MLKKTTRVYEEFQAKKYWENVVQKAAWGQVPSCLMNILGTLLLHFAACITFLRHHTCQEQMRVKRRLRNNWVRDLQRLVCLVALL